MKKIKLFALSLGVMFISLFTVACSCSNDQPKVINVSKIYFTYNDELISENGVEVNQGGSISLTLKYEPLDATEKDFEIVDYNENLISVSKENEVYTITAKSEFDETVSIFETTLRVKANNSDIEPASCKVTVVKEYETLPSPTDVRFDGETLEWNAVTVDKFENYTIKVNDEEFTTYEPKISFDKINMYDEDLIIKVKANGIFDFYDSEYSVEIKIKKLSRIENLQLLENQIISFDKNENASEYSLYINDTPIKSINKTQSQVDVSEFIKDAGTYNIYLIANGSKDEKEFTEYDSSKSEIITLKRLDVVNNFKLENNILSWDAVDGANSYVVSYRKKDGNDLELTTKFVKESVNSYYYELSQSFINNLEECEYEFTVSAKGNNKDVLDGGIGQIVRVEKLRTLTLDLKEMLVNKDETSELLNVITWDKVKDNETYEVSINDLTPIIINGKNYIELNSAFASGLYSVRVKMLGDGSKTFSGDYSKEIGVRKLDAVNLETFNYDENSGVVTFTSNYADNQDFEILVNNQKAEYFEIDDGTSEIDNKDVKIGFNVLNNVVDAGEYKIVVKVKNRTYQRNEQDNSNFYGYTDSEYSSAFVVTKLEKPTLTFDGTNISISSIVGAKSYDLKVFKTNAINGQETKVLVGVCKNLTSTRVDFNSLDFVKDESSVTFEEGVTYQICAVLNGQSTNQFKTISSDGSENLLIQILSAPTVIVNTEKQNIDTKEFFTSSKFTIINASQDASSFDYFVTNLNNNNIDVISKDTYESESGYNSFISKYSSSVYNKGILVQAVANGKVSNSSNGINYITSKKSNGVKFYQLPVATLNAIQSEKLIFNKITFADYDSNEIQYSVRFMIGEDVVYIDNNITFTKGEDESSLEYLLTNAINSIFELKNEDNTKKYDLDKSNFTIKVDVIANGSNVLLSNNVSSSLSFEKLKNPEVKITDINTLANANLNNLSLQDLPGQIVIGKVDNALGYVVYPYLNGQLYGSALYIPSFNADYFNFQYQDDNVQGGKYTFKVVALGNDEKIIQSNETLLEINKYSAPVVQVKNGDISWITEYNKGLMPDCLFILKISTNSIENYYIPYDLTNLDFNNVSSLMALKNVKSCVFPEELPSGTEYTITIYSIPTNLTESTNILSDGYSINNVTKLPTPSISFIKDGKFYFSDVTGSTQYDVLVNDERYSLKVNGSQLTSSKVGAFELTKNNENLYIFNFQDLYGEISGKYEIKVSALSSTDNIVSSSYTISVNTEVLSAPIVSISDGVINYSGISNATDYTIKIYSASLNNGTYQKGELINEFTEKDISITEYDFVKYNDNGTWMYNSGYYMFEIVANGDGVNYITKTKTDDDKNEKYVYKLSAPTELKINQGKLAWTTSETTTNLRILAQNSKILDYEFTSNDKTYALDDKFNATNYSSIQLQMLGKNDYLNSNISDKIKISANSNKTYKLTIPQIRTNNGEFEIIHNDRAKTTYYEIKIGNMTYNIGKDFSWKIVEDKDNLKIQLYKIVNGELIENTGNYLTLTGTQAVQIRAVGSYDSDVSGWYFTSDYSSLKQICVLNNVSNIRMEDGELYWDLPQSNSEVSGNLKLVYTINDDLAEYSVAINDINTYHFDEPNTYNIYFVNVGNTNSSASGIFTLNSKKSDTYKFVKTERPSQISSSLDDETQIVTLSVEQKANYNYKFVLDDIIEIYQGGENSIELQIIQKQATVNNEIKVYNVLKINGKVVELNGHDYELGEIYSIKVMYVGTNETSLGETTYYFSSEYSEPLNGTIPNAPVLNVEVVEDGNDTYYTGRVTWEPVTFNNGKEIVDSYIVTTYYFSDLYSIKSIEDGVITLVKDNVEYEFNEEKLKNEADSVKTVTIQNTFINADKAGTYVRYIKSLLSSSGSYSTSSICAFNYNVFASGDGTEQDPYLINSVKHFENIKYNMQKGVYYKLGCDLDFSNKSYEIVGNENDIFNANFDGNGHTIKNVTINSVIRDYVGLFGYVGKDAKVKDLTVENINSNNGYFVGGIAGYNLGIIENCTTSGSLGTNYSSLSLSAYNGGIVGYNAGTIIHCTSDVIVVAVSVRGDKSTYAGGIAGINTKDGKIEYCINNGQIGNNNNASQYAGGIVGENNGQISYCKNTNDVYGVSVSNSFEAYVGGLVGKNNTIVGKGINNCLTNGNVYVSYVKSSAKLYAGGLVGYNYNGIITDSMLAIKSSGQKLVVSGNSSVSSNLIVGALIGYNNVSKESARNLFVYDNISVIANNVNIDKIVGLGLSISNSNASDIYIIKDQSDLTLIIKDNFSSWKVDGDIIDNNIDGNYKNGDKLNEEI